MPRSRRHYRLKYADAILAHDIGLRHRPGLPGILSENSIKAAIARPYSGYYRPIRKKGAALVESVCLNHGFTDGNKRTAVILLGVMLDLSGYYLHPVHGEDLDDSIEGMVIAVANGEMTFDDIETWLDKRIRKKPEL